MRIYQPMLFVGLGGAGCQVGVELEKRLRQELCGTDGSRLLPEMQDQGFLPYQLPSCLQFVYADLSANELQRVRQEVAPGPEQDQAVAKTMHLISGLVPPKLADSAAVAQSLRINIDEDTVDWLPSREGDPHVGPLDLGAGQLPMVARSSLFETLRCNPGAPTLAIKDALRNINESGADLFVLSGKRTWQVGRVAVFVAFSVAGGTGSGIYYDYLHLIGDLMRQGDIRAEIYPLVLMPSAFAKGLGGGRAADLNAGSALVDLFQLIDDQNAPGSAGVLDHTEAHETVSVRYPTLNHVRLERNTVQTAFLFGRQVDRIHRDDLYRSMVALMTALIGNDRLYRSFARGLINSQVDRQAIADTGVGRRGVTTTVVAELTIPLPELIDIVSSRLLANAVNELLVPAGAAETNTQHIRQFISAAGLEQLLEPPRTRIPPHGSPVGYDAVRTALAERANAMRANVDRGEKALVALTAGLAQDFDPAAGAAALLGSLDPFRLQRTIFGHEDLTDPFDRGGVQSLLEVWRSTPTPPREDIGIDRPPLPEGLRTRPLQRLRITNSAAQAVVEAQDAWYAWQSRRIWNKAWNDSHRLWNRPWQEFAEEFQAIHDQFVTYARDEPQQFDLRREDLYRPRAGVTYLLPSEDHGIDDLYQAVLTRLRKDYSQFLTRDAHEGNILNLILGQDGWAAAFAVGRNDPGAAVALVRRRIREAVSAQVRPHDRRRVPLIPKMEDLLANAVQRQDNSATEGDPYRFHEKLADLLLGGALVPDGHASMKVLASYPATQNNTDIERFLSRTVSLPGDATGEPEFRPVQIDSITAILISHPMGITDAPELRKVIRLWAEANRSPHPRDTLPWRRRLHPHTGYPVMTRADRQRILHCLLCAAWNGKIVTAGSPESPDHIIVEIGTKRSERMKLELTPLGTLSSWASLLQAYERWMLSEGSQTKKHLVAQLVLSTPAHPDPTLSLPAAEFGIILNLATTELTKMNEPERNRLLSGDPQLTVFREFWSQDLPSALSQRIGVTSSSLSDLHERARNDKNELAATAGQQGLELMSESPKVFLSYSREDEILADKLYHGLKNHGMNVWKDDHDLLPGEDWEGKIRRIFVEYEFVILCLSQVAITKQGFFQVELKLAARNQQERPRSAVYTIPVKIDAQLRHQDLPLEIAALHVVDLTADWVNGVQKIVTSVFRYRRGVR